MSNLLTQTIYIKYCDSLTTCCNVHNSSIIMEALLVPYGNIVEGSRRSLSHISSKDVITKTSTDKVLSNVNC